PSLIEVSHSAIFFSGSSASLASASKTGEEAFEEFGARRTHKAVGIEVVFNNRCGSWTIASTMPRATSLLRKSSSFSSEHNVVLVSTYALPVDARWVAA